jgi:hypothetical protein
MRVGSYATAATRFAIPDTGLLSLEELAAITPWVHRDLEDCIARLRWWDRPSWPRSVAGSQDR